MPYIVIDLEWNQAMSAKAPVFNRLPIHLRGEIIQIGAVKLNSDSSPGDEFQCDVRPVWFRKMHYKVKKLTGLDEERLSRGLSFPEAMEAFTAWCGDDCTFLTWGFDDRGIMEQNLILHDMEIDWLGRWINLQPIYNLQTGSDRNQKSLETAMEHFDIEQTRTAHDALGDAYNTALVCARLDLSSGLTHYEELLQRLPRTTGTTQGPAPLLHTISGSYDTRDDLWQAEDEAVVRCPACGCVLERTKWVSQGDRRYMALAACPEHGSYLLRIRLRREDDDTWHANHLLYQADEEMVESFWQRQSRHRRGRRRKRRPDTLS